MTTIQDGVHGRIRLCDLALDLIETPQVQRLRNISQLGTVDYVYPSSNHTRFEHTLGVYYLLQKALQRLDIDTRTEKHLIAASILHDVGHSPFSHTFEHVVYEHTGCYHDDVEVFLRGTEVENVLRNHGLDFDTVTDFINGNGKYGSLISGKLDVDRMDYLVRDAAHTGVPYGTIDHEYLLDSLVFYDDVLAVKHESIQSAENLLIARALMEPTVYRHHVSRITGSMLSRACQAIIRDTTITAEEIRRMDDYEFTSIMRETTRSQPMASRLQQRNLFKRAIWTDINTILRDMIGLSVNEERQIEREIVSEGDTITNNDVIVDSPSYPSIKESDAQVLVNNTLQPLQEESPLVNAIIDRNYKQWRFGVYAPEESVDEVKQAAMNVLNIESEEHTMITSSPPRSEGQLHVEHGHNVD